MMDVNMQQRVYRRDRYPKPALARYLLEGEITLDQHDAGECFRDNYLAALRCLVAGEDVSKRAEQFQRVDKELGTLRHVAVACICHGQDLTAWAKAHGHAPAAGLVLLRLALDVLVRAYGCGNRLEAEATEAALAYPRV